MSQPRRSDSRFILIYRAAVSTSCDTAQQSFAFTNGVLPIAPTKPLTIAGAGFTAVASPRLISLGIAFVISSRQDMQRMYNARRHSSVCRGFSADRDPLLCYAKLVPMTPKTQISQARPATYLLSWLIAALRNLIACFCCCYLPQVLYGVPFPILRTLRYLPH